MARGGKREGAGKFSRGLPVIKASLYRRDHEKISNIAKSFTVKIPVIELIHRIINHKDFNNMVKDIDNNIEERWHEQEIIKDKE